MIRLVLKILKPVLPHLYRLYLSKPRYYRYDGLKVICRPGVFYPGFIGSTKHLLDYLQDLELNGMKLLELGCGTGIISLFASRKGARVTASDINPLAVENTRENASQNKINLTVIQSDLFSNLPVKGFDIIIINPPYFAREPENHAEMAWFCGKDYEYFQKLFPQLKMIDPSAVILMILSEDCNIARIKEIADKSGFVFHLKNSGKRMGEWNYIFQIILQH